MSEGHVYLCKQVKTDDGVKVWLERRPKLFAHGETLDEALEELSDVVCLATGDGEAIFEVADEGRGDNSYVTLGWNSTWSPVAGADRTSLGELFDGGLCQSCCSGIGPRTKKRLAVSNLGEGSILAGRLRLPRIFLVSERLRKLLTRSERNELTWKPIDNQSRSRRVFFEVQAKRALPAVTDRNQTYGGWLCPECKLNLFSVYDNDKNAYVCVKDIPLPRPKLLTINAPHGLQIALTRKRWKEIRPLPGAASGPTRNVVELSATRAIRNPKLKSLTASFIRSINSEFDQDVALPRLRKV